MHSVENENEDEQPFTSEADIEEVHGKDEIESSWYDKLMMFKQFGPDEFDSNVLRFAQLHTA